MYQSVFLCFLSICGLGAHIYTTYFSYLYTAACANTYFLCSSNFTYFHTYICVCVYIYTYMSFMYQFCAIQHMYFSVKYTCTFRLLCC